MVSFLNIINGYPVSVLPSVWLAPWRRRGHQGERGDQGERVLVGGWIWLGGSREGIFRTTQSMLELECHPRWDLGDHHECREDLLFLLPHPLFLPPHLPLCLLLFLPDLGGGGRRHTRSTGGAALSASSSMSSATGIWRRQGVEHWPPPSGGVRR